MSCSFPGLNNIGYEPACMIHDIDYSIDNKLWTKVKADFRLASNMNRLGAWHSLPIAIATFCVLSVWYDSYKRFYKS